MMTWKAQRNQSYGKTATWNLALMTSTRGRLEILTFRGGLSSRLPGSGMYYLINRIRCGGYNSTRRLLLFFWKQDVYSQKGSWKKYTVHLVGFCDYIILARDAVVVEPDFSNFGFRYLQRVNNVRVSSAIYQSVYML